MPEPREITTQDREALYQTLTTPGARLLLDLLQSEADAIVNALESWTLDPANERQLLAYLKAYRSILRTLKAHHLHLAEESRALYDVEGPVELQEGVSDELAIVE